MKIAVGISWYKDPLIFRLLDSIPESWDILLIDGRYIGMDDFDEYSSKDLILKIRQDYPNVIIEQFSNMEYVKRNRYLELAKGYDFLLVLDSDEYISEFNEQVFNNSIKNLTDGFHLISFIENDKPTQYGRLFAKPHNWRYSLSHKNIETKGQKRPVSKTDSKIEGITICHDDTLRPTILKRQIEDYQTRLWKYEADPSLLSAKKNPNN